MIELQAGHGEATSEIFVVEAALEARKKKALAALVTGYDEDDRDH